MFPLTLSAYSIPVNKSKLQSRLKCNIYYYRTNYAIIVAFTFIIALIMRPLGFLSLLWCTGDEYFSLSSSIYCLMCHQYRVDVASTMCIDLNRRYLNIASYVAHCLGPSRRLVQRAIGELRSLPTRSCGTMRKRFVRTLSLCRVGKANSPCESAAGNGESKLDMELLLTFLRRFVRHVHMVITVESTPFCPFCVQKMRVRYASSEMKPGVTGSSQPVHIFFVPRPIFMAIGLVIGLMLVWWTRALLRLAAAWILGVLLVGLHASFRKQNVKARFESTKGEATKATTQLTFCSLFLAAAKEQLVCILGLQSNSQRCGTRQLRTFRRTSSWRTPCGI